MFCSKCKSLMRSNGKEWCCSRCGEKKLITEGETIKQESRESMGRVVVDEEQASTLPTTNDVECPKCGHNKATWRIRQMRAADEPETRLFRCCKCQHTWRDNA